MDDSVFESQTQGWTQQGSTTNPRMQNSKEPQKFKRLSLFKLYGDSV